MRDLLAEDEVLHERGAARTPAQRILVVSYRHSLVGGQTLARVIADRVLHLFGP
jgi:hypothetical protein